MDKIKQKMSKLVYDQTDKVKSFFTKHPEDNDLTYTEHFKRSIKFSLKMFYGSAALFIHAFFPFMFEKTGSRIIIELDDEMIIKSD
jgi:hypothetical protein